ncbi:MAG TPA: endolytic transglycosylase MltG [Treponemataceae bacterium]|nr:endolytic transglycosylase MltG [Treponemataceae bacterium]HQF72312.1 endolytic transglycosylase MltG [Treponemataceae bacterium]
MKSVNYVKLFFWLILIVAAVGSGMFVAFLRMDSPVDPSGEPVLFTVKKGSSILYISSSLQNAGLVRSAFAATVLARIRPYSLKAGTYRVSPAMNTDAILRQLHEGRQESVRITIPEGLTITKTARQFDEAGIVSSAEFLEACRNRRILEQFGIPSASAEGFLFPDTYQFHYGVQGDEVVSTMIDNFFRKTMDMENLPDTREKLFEKVILASIVEREYRVAREAPLIASVFANRLKIGMGLQSCSTIEYIITEIQGKPHPTRLLTVDLEIPSDYNTYLWAGLPPGPISNPGKTALSAAFNPPRSKYLYFRLTDPVQGTHVFTSSLDEHVDAGREIYLKKAAGN